MLFLFRTLSICPDVRNKSKFEIPWMSKKSNKTNPFPNVLRLAMIQNTKFHGQERAIVLLARRMSAFLLSTVFSMVLSATTLAAPALVMMWALSALPIFSLQMLIFSAIASSAIPAKTKVLQLDPLSGKHKVHGLQRFLLFALTPLLISRLQAILPLHLAKFPRFSRFPFPTTTAFPRNLPATSRQPTLSHQSMAPSPSLSTHHFHGLPAAHGHPASSPMGQPHVPAMGPFLLRHRHSRHPLASGEIQRHHAGCHPHSPDDFTFTVVIRRPHLRCHGWVTRLRKRHLQQHLGHRCLSGDPRLSAFLWMYWRPAANPSRGSRFLWLHRF